MTDNIVLPPAGKIWCTCKNKQCGVRFLARIADRKRGWGKFCSKSCKAYVQEKTHGHYKAHRTSVYRDYNDVAWGSGFDNTSCQNSGD